MILVSACDKVQKSAICVFGTERSVEDLTD